MIIFIFGTYLTIFIALRIYSDFNIKQNQDETYKFFKRIIQITNVGFILFPILFVGFFWYAIGVSFETQYDVKRGSWMWFVRMENNIVNDFPIIDPIRRAKYNDVGGDNPHIGAAWSVEFISKKNKEELLPIIREYLAEEGITISSVIKTPCRLWREHERRVFYTSITKFDGQCLELEITPLGNGTTSVEFYISV